ncbi:MAG: YigZ family protein [Acholeplasmataceae bacterium]|nr:YigZ family protein [Acholeplasmataceae bacterium]
MYTIVRDFQQEIVIEKSRFICTLKKVATEEEAQDFIKETKKKYWDATHNCSAYIVGESGAAQRSNDDGEPSGTAGLPMLEVLRKNNLHNVAAVVTRYFGGVKLGAGGLVRAYTNSVAAAIEEAGIAEKVLFGYFYFIQDINSAGKVLNILYQQNLFTVSSVEYDIDAKIVLRMPMSLKTEADGWLTEALNTEVELIKEKEEYVEQPLTSNK